MEGYVQLFSKNAKLSRFLTINVTATNNSAANVAGGAKTGNDKDDKVVMEEESEKEKKPWKCLDDLKKKFISKKLLFCVNI